MRPIISAVPTDDPNVQDILVIVKETHTGSFQIGAGFNTDNGLVGSIVLNGAVVDRFTPQEAHLAREYGVKAAPGNVDNILEMSVDRTSVPAREHVGEDPRELGLLVRYLSWGPLQ